jgi:YidC/Oxa1 family membrane protein insertase
MDTQRIIAVIVFSFSAVLLWNAWQKHNQPPPAPIPTLSTPGAGTPVRAPSTADVPTFRTGNAVEQVGSGAIQPSEAGKVVTVRTDKFDAEINSQGGDIRRVILREHFSAIEKDKPLSLLQSTDGHYFVTQSGLLGGLPNHNSVFSTDAANFELKPGQEKLEVRFVNRDTPGVEVTKIFTFRPDAYLIDVAYQVKNETENTITPVAYFQFVRDGNPPEGEAAHSSPFTGVVTYTGPAVYTNEKKFVKESFSDIDKGKQDYPKNGTDGWLAMVQHYFVVAWLPKQGTEREYFTRKVSDKLYSAGVIVSAGQIAANQTSTIDMPLYVGPQEQDKLKELAPGLDLVVDYGWLRVIAVPLFWLLKFIYGFVGNWGWAIIVMTILIKMVFFPLNQKAGKSMAHMKSMAPRIEQLRQRYGDDRVKLNQAMMELYRTEKINPLGGCLPIVVQIPVFIALYWVLLAAIELRHTPWLGWIQDLSAPDPLYILPLIMAVSMFIQTKLNPPPPDPVQAKVMMIMPIVFSIFFFFFPAGLVLYWTMQNILGIVQQWLINKSVEKHAKSRAVSKR